MGRMGGIMAQYEKKINLVICKGVGSYQEKDKGPDWFNPMMKNILNFSNKISNGKITKDFFNVYSVNWGYKAEALQNGFKEIYRKHVKNNFGPIDWILDKITSGISNAMISSMGDVLMVFDEMQWPFFRNEVRNTLKRAVIESRNRRTKAGLPGNSQTITLLVGHSLGSVILFKFCHEIGRTSSNYGMINETRKGLKLNSLITYGSPCSFWDWLAAKGIKPRFPDETNPELKPVWLNFWAQRDPVSAPVVPYFANYYGDTANLIDKKLVLPGRLGRLPVIAHTRYAKSRNMGLVIARRIRHIYEILNEA